ncbi:MAG: hypothetical protein Q8N81_03245 [bacterium]|nr:hypothetical protein [bacterium]
MIFFKILAFLVIPLASFLLYSMTFLKSHRTTILTVSLLLIVAGALFLVRTHRLGTGIVAGATAYRSLATEAPKTVAEEAAAGLAELKAGQQMTYCNPTYYFCFRYPKTFKIGYLPQDGNGETVLVHKDNGFQVHVEPFDENAVLTPERIKKDLPDMAVDNPEYIDINGTVALKFEGKNGFGEKTREVWFVHLPAVYQLTASPEYDSLLTQIFKTWSWD